MDQLGQTGPVSKEPTPAQNMGQLSRPITLTKIDNSTLRRHLQAQGYHLLTQLIMCTQNVVLMNACCIPLRNLFVIINGASKEIERTIGVQLWAVAVAVTNV